MCFKNFKFALGRIENIVRKAENAGYQHFAENAGYQHFLLFPQYFQKASSLESLKVVIVWKRANKSSANAFNLDQPTILLFDKGLIDL